LLQFNALCSTTWLLRGSGLVFKTMAFVFMIHLSNDNKLIITASLTENDFLGSG